MSAAEAENEEAPDCVMVAICPNLLVVIAAVTVAVPSQVHRHRTVAGAEVVSAASRVAASRVAVSDVQSHGVARSGDNAPLVDGFAGGTCRSVSAARFPPFRVAPDSASHVLAVRALVARVARESFVAHARSSVRSPSPAHTQLCPDRVRERQQSGRGGREPLLFQASGLQQNYVSALAHCGAYWLANG